MFQSISWPEFFSAILILGLLYYGIAGFVLYRAELGSFFKNGFVTRKQTDTPEEQSGYSLMGATASRPKQEDIEDYEDFVAGQDSNIVGTVADLGEEIKTLSGRIAQASAQQIGEAYKQLLGKYGRLHSTSYRPTINLLISETIREHSSHAIDAKTVDTWWTKSNQS